MGPVRGESEVGGALTRRVWLFLSLIWLNTLPVFLAQRQWPPLLSLPGTGPYARPALGPLTAVPYLGRLWSRPERDGCLGGTDKADR